MSTETQLTDTAIVTGATYGIGRASAIALAQEGWNLVLTDLNPDTLEPVLAEVRALGVQAIGRALEIGRAHV